jgi:tetratricopeptide (TPR) repeat protein
MLGGVQVPTARPGRLCRRRRLPGTGRRKAPGPLLFAAVVVALPAAFPPAARAADDNFWAEAARIDERDAARLRAEAGVLVSGEIGEISERAAAAALANSRDRPARLVQAEGKLRGAVRLAPGDLALRLDLATLQAMRGDAQAEVATLEQALRLVAPTDVPERAAIWLRLGDVRARLGRNGEAIASYELALAAGVGAAPSYIRLAELLMAEGRLGDAEARFREAAAVAAARGTGYADRLARSQELARAFFGLAVALDRAERPIAAREAVRRALDQDPAAAVLTSAIVPAGEPPVILPEGEVFYYVGLAAEADGRSSYAESSFREYLAATPGGRWTQAALRHLGERPPPPRQGGSAGPLPKARIAAFGTVYASGPIAAPLVDIGWRARPALLDDCLAGVRVPGGARVAVELEIDGRGAVTRATIKAPPPFDEGFVRCAEEAVRRELTFGAPAPGDPRAPRKTIARTEIILAPAQ